MFSFIGPCIGMDCLHGVLMHNDDGQGEDHKVEDQYLRFKDALDTDTQPVGPKDAENFMHDTLMHGDSGNGHHHEESEKNLPEVVSQAGPKDLNDVIHEGMHGEGGIPHKHDWDKAEDGQQVNTKKGPLDAEHLMHGVLMHGDENHVHDDDDDGDTDLSEEQKVPSTLDAEGLMHGILMHGDAEHGKDHDHDDKMTVEEINFVGPDGSSLHGILMHNDDTIGHDHSHEDSNAVHDVFSDISKIRDIVFDEDLLKIIDLEKILMKDMEEYTDFLLNEVNTEGSTVATVSDSILADIELMKNRYLSLEDSDENVMTSYDTATEIPFTADDANAILEGHVHEGDGEDMTHDLELLGSTEPLNARHKVKMTLDNEKK